MISERISPKATCWATIRDAERAVRAEAAQERTRHELDAQEAEAAAIRHAVARRAQRETAVVVPA